ncbi:exonuclease domain-containing protein [Candidatus Dojkabacteria bacterium]|jgi:DNA polymerase-3 subunit epsilon|nr:exonuclease domain-containing protein [Candidatus Dojkabacteria bacterium]
MKRLFVDTETTGTDKEKHGVHQISGIIEIDGKVMEMFDIKLCPFEGCVYEQEAMDVTGKTVEEIKQYQSESDGYQEFTNLLCRYVQKFNKKDKFIVVGYNVKFDIEFLYQLFIRNNDNYLFSFIWGNPIEVMTMATLVFEKDRPEMENFQLGTVVKKAGITVNSNDLHNAVTDIKITYELFYKLYNMKYNIDDFINPSDDKAMIIITKPLPKPNRATIDYLFPFGKYKGQSVSSMIDDDPQYVIWWNENVEKFSGFDDSVIEEANQIINSKRL